MTRPGGGRTNYAAKGSEIRTVYMTMPGGYDQAQRVFSDPQEAEEYAQSLRDQGKESWVGVWIAE